MITRRSGYLSISADPAPAATEQLQREGYVVLPGVLSPAETKALGEDIERVFEEYPPDERVPGLAAEHWVPFRYEMLNRSEACQRAVAHPSILQVIEPLLGEDCHVIANTAWRQPEAESDHGGRFWHIDSGPHVPRDPAVAWDERIPYPVFAVAAHLFIWDCPIEAGATGIIPGSHTSGQAPPIDRMADDDLEWGEQAAVPVVAAAGDVALFVSDVWHRACPPAPMDRVASSSSATTAGATWPSASVPPAPPTISRPRRWPEPRPNASARSSACTGPSSTTADRAPRRERLGRPGS